MGIKAFITGVEGHALTSAERDFIDHEHPWGLILFARNIDEPKQVHRLVDEFREQVGRAEAPVLIDQEGGRVQRLKPPHWANYATGTDLGRLWQVSPRKGARVTYLHSRLIANDLATLGINVDCLPVLDLPAPECHEVIGDRAYGTDPEQVSKLGRIACEGLLAGGVLPVLKHVPGHGRARADSHKELPEVGADRQTLGASDFLPFHALADMPMAMTAHVRYTAIDPAAPATTSPILIEEVIRGEIGFDGLLMSDDLSMRALSGDFSERTEAAFAAGCDLVLHCNGVMDEMMAVAAVCPILDGVALERAERALARLKLPDAIDVDALRAEYQALLDASAELADIAETG